jgi:predicted ATP-grasp superfamily ATP-dependent carboligase
MRILVHEFFSGGGLVGRDVPAALVREGSAMLAALIADLAEIGRHRIVATADPRFPLAAPPGVDVVKLSRGSVPLPNALIDAADAVWLIAPETDRCLEQLAARVERRGKALLGCGAAAIRTASNKAALPGRLARHRVPHPRTRVLRRPDTDCHRAARQVGYPLVVKPGRGAGCCGVSLARDSQELRDAVDAARRAGGGGPLLLQRYIAGAAASVSLLADGRRAVPLAVNGQIVRASR